MSLEIETFLKQNGLRNPTSTAYHPSSNGLAERGGQVVKHGLKKVREGSLESRTAKVLFTTGPSHWTCCSRATVWQDPTGLSGPTVPKSSLTGGREAGSTEKSS